MSPQKSYKYFNFSLPPSLGRTKLNRQKKIRKKYLIGQFQKVIIKSQLTSSLKTQISKDVFTLTRNSLENSLLLFRVFTEWSQYYSIVVRAHKYIGGLALKVISPKIWEFFIFFMSTLGINQPHLKSFSAFT